MASFFTQLDTDKRL